MAPSDNFWDSEELSQPARMTFNKRGDEIKGTLQHLEMRPFGEGDQKRTVPVLFIGESLDESTEVICGSKNLIPLLRKMKPAKGDDIRIRFVGETALRGPGNRAESHWMVEVNGEVETSN
jgi:hypothetical protein